MIPMQKKFVNKYIRQVKRFYKGNRKAKKQFICELRDALFCYCEKNPTATYDDLLSEFGAPSDIKNMLSFRTAKDLRKRNMLVHWILIVGICIIVLAAVAFTVFHVLARYDFSQGYSVEYFEDDPNAPRHVNPLTGKPDPTPITTITFD